MLKLIVKWLLSASALLFVAYVYSGVELRGFGAAMAAALVIGLLNTVVRPVLVVLTLPVTVLTLGLFLFVINALMFWAAAGLLQGCYAFLGVAAFWLRQAGDDPHEPGGTGDRVAALAEFTRWRDAVRLGLRTLTSGGVLTEAGERFVAGMQRTLDSWADVPVPSRTRERADRAAREHRERWIAANGPIAAPG